MLSLDSRARGKVSKSRDGNFFEDFKLGQLIEHATPRTVTVGDVSLYTALYGSRFAVQSSDAFAKAVGYPRSPIEKELGVIELVNELDFAIPAFGRGPAGLAA